MTYSKTQLEIIKAFGSKELSEGCLISSHEYINNDLWEELVIKKYVTKTDSPKYHPNYCIATDWKEYCIYGILWHIPELFPDVARVAKEKWYPILTDSWIIEFQLSDTEFVRIPYESTLPLIDQDEQLTLIPLLSLIK